jgi:hypothetical protein
MGEFEMDLAAAGCEDVEWVESSTWFSTGVSELWASKKREYPPPLATELLLLEIYGFCGL